MLDNTNKQWEVEGLNVVIDALESLPPKLSLNLLRSVNRKALTQEIVKPLRSALPYSANIKKNIKVAADKLDKTGVIAAPSTDVFWVRFLEGGTVERFTESGAARGYISGRKTIEPFYDSKTDDVIDFARDEYAETIITFMNKKLKRIKKSMQ